MSTATSRPAFLSLLLLLSIGRVAHSQNSQPLQYVLGRFDDPFGYVNAVCLGTSTSYAFAYSDPNGSPPQTIDDTNIQVNTNPTASSTNANFLYVGNIDFLQRSLFCASYNYNFLYNGTTFLWTGTDPLPGDVGNHTYVSSIWKASPGAAISLTVRNLVEDSWNVDLTPKNAGDLFLYPQQTSVYQVSGSAYDGSIAGKPMLESFVTALLSDPAAVLDNFRYGTSYSTMLMDEGDGTVIYYFFFVYKNTSTFCRPPGVTNTSDCIIGSTFQAKYDVSNVDFEAYHCLYDQSSCPPYGERRRRLLTEQPTRVLRVEEDIGRILRGRRLATTPTTTRPGSTRSTVCRIVKISCTVRGRLTTCPRTVCS